MRWNAALKMAAVVTTTALMSAGCSSGSSSGSDSSSSKGTDLSFWAWAPNMDKVVDIWNQEHPESHVTVHKQDGGDPAVTKLLTAIKAGKGAPDIMQVEYQKLPTLVSADALADVSDVIDTKTVSAAFPPALWDTVTLGSDAVYAVPEDTGPMAFYYRADVFDSLGLKPPTTWDEYAQDARAIHQADPADHLGTFSANDAGWFAGLTQQAGASWWDTSGKSWSVDIDSAASQKVASYWGGLVAEGVIDNKPMYTPEWNAGLNDGTQVGWLSAVWAPGVLSGNAEDTAGKWKVAPMPQWDPAKPATGAWGGSGTGVTSQSEHAKEAGEFVQWLNTDPEAVKALSTISGIYPAATAAQAAQTAPPDFFSNQPDYYQVTSQIASTLAPFTYGPNVNVAYNAYNDAFGEAAESKSQPAFLDALESMQSTTVADLKSSGFSVK